MKASYQRQLMSAQAVNSNGRPLTVISTFAGCGGSLLGYQMAGFRDLLAVEQEAHAVEMLHANFPDLTVYPGDISKLSAPHCMELAGIAPRELDILDGSPPCQGFSSAGKHEYKDPRNSLSGEFARLLETLQPRTFVLENVPGMVMGVSKQVYLQITAALRAAGYRVKGAIMNAAFFGVPQMRKRVIIVGVREDLDIAPSHPTPQQSSPITVKEAIGHLPLGTKGNHSPDVIRAWYMSKPGQVLRKAVHFVGSFQSVRLNPNRPSSTQVRAHLNWHWAIPRQLTIQEAAIIQGFPEDFIWVGTKSEQKARIGNSVPPKLMEVVARHLRTMILVPKASFSVSKGASETPALAPETPSA